MVKRAIRLLPRFVTALCADTAYEQIGTVFR